MNYGAVTLEILTALLGLGLLVMGLVIPRDQRKGVGYVALFGILIILVMSFFTGGKDVSLFKGFYVVDVISLYFKQLFLIAAVLVIAMSLRYVDKLQDNKSEFFALLVFALLGMMVMASAYDFVTVYLGLELMTITFVILTAYDRNNKKSSEAGMKYILLSAMSSGILLYGISIIYGMVGSTGFADVIKYLQNGVIEPFMILAIIFLIAGLGFKISAVPFHMWSPDIYEGAPTPVTAFLAVGSKAAGFAVLIRLFLQVMPATHSIFSQLIVVLAAMTMIIGNFIAIPQTNIKRMLAYSSIAHAGYILLGLIAFTKLGIGAMLYYMLLYIFGNVGAFAAVTAFSNQTGSDEIKDFTGMWKRSPFLAAVMLISLLSLAGIPPAAGFVGKFFLFAAIIKQGYLWLSFLALGMSMISVYYYLMVIKVMLMGEVEDNTPINVPTSLKAIMVISAAMTLFMGLYPGPVVDWTARIAQAFLK